MPFFTVLIPLLSYGVPPFLPTYFLTLFFSFLHLFLSFLLLDFLLSFSSAFFLLFFLHSHFIYSFLHILLSSFLCSFLSFCLLLSFPHNLRPFHSCHSFNFSILHYLSSTPYFILSFLKSRSFTCEALPSVVVKICRYLFITLFCPSSV
jgi:hypothetical protein